MHPFLIQVGPLTIPAYGAAVAVGYLLGIAWLKTQIRWMPGMNEEKFWLMIYGLFFGAIMGGKLLFVALNLQDYWTGRMGFFKDFRFGFVFFGGLLGAMGMGVLCARWLKFPYLPMADFYGVALPMGHAVGRLGCLAAGCCYGKPTDLPWGIAMGGHPASNTPEELWGIPLHPTQLYESAAVAAITAFLLFYVLPRVKRKQIVAGTVFLGYLALYSLARFVIEFYRGDDRGGDFLALSVSQWISLAVAAASAETMRRRGLWAKR